MDGKTVAALVPGACRVDRFCEGALLAFLKTGTMGKWLLRLKETEQA